uniref:COP9 signalosome complex subunit 2 n=1 Tax=Panagrellus redivivus TaxID=6233 RepID=A0A7E4VXW2_PANRE
MPAERISREDAIRRSAPFLASPDKLYPFFAFFDFEDYGDSFKAVLGNILARLKPMTTSISPEQVLQYAHHFYDAAEVASMEGYGNIVATNLVTICTVLRSQMPSTPIDVAKMLFACGLQRRADNDLFGAIGAFEGVLNLAGCSKEAACRAREQLIFAAIGQEHSEALIEHTHLLTQMVVDVKYATRHSLPYRQLVETTVCSVLDVISQKIIDESVRLSVYGTVLETLKLAPNDNLWFNISYKLALLYLRETDYATLDTILTDLKVYCTNNIDINDSSLLSVYALEMDKCALQNNNKAFQIVYQALKIKAAIPHPLITGTIRECGGKMHLRNGDYEQAHTDFCDAFKNYDEAGSARRIACLKYLVLANMLIKSNINPFDSEETKAFRDEPDIDVMTRLISAYQSYNLKQFRDIIDDPNNTVLSDPFIAEHLAELKDNVRSEVLRQIISPYTSISLQYLSEELCISVSEVTRLLTVIILDNDAQYRIDQPGGMLYGIDMKQTGQQRECVKSLESVIKQLSQMR